jgi:hypothetical protein
MQSLKLLLSKGIATVTNCDRDHFCAKMTQNLWEESGKNGGVNHAEIFRNFMKNSLFINDFSQIKYESFTQKFVDLYLQNSIQAESLWEVRGYH